MTNENRKIMDARIKAMKATHDMKKLKNPCNSSLKGLTPIPSIQAKKKKTILKQTTQSG